MALTPLSKRDMDEGDGSIPAAEPDATRQPVDFEQSLETGLTGRTLKVYPASAGYDLREELDFLTARAMEDNVFFSAQFLAPAMPRLEDRTIRLMVIRDDNEARSRLRFLMPFSVEKPGMPVGPSIIRSWSNPFGPLGTPLLDSENAAETIGGLFDAINRPESGLPSILVLPNLRRDGPFASVLRGVALSRNLTIAETDPFERPVLRSDVPPAEYLEQTISAKHRREHRRQKRKLSELGKLAYHVARNPEEVRQRAEEFLTLEASGWKGSRRSALAMDRYRAAFTREAITNLAEKDNVRIHTLDLDGRAIASMIVFVMNGTAYTWKTAFDENYSQFSPGQLLVEDLTETLLEDPNIDMTDSCAVPDHPVMSRSWQERSPMSTVIVGLNEAKDREVRQVAKQLHLYHETRNFGRRVREKLRSMIGLK